MSCYFPERTEIDWKAKDIERLKEKVAALEEYLGIELYEVPLHVKYVKKGGK